MSSDLDPLILDLLRWIAPEPKPYAEVMEAWRTSCPRLTVWEEALDRGLVARERVAGRGDMIAVTALGEDMIHSSRRTPPN